MAAVVTTGDIDPTTPPENWWTNINAYIGKTADGTMTIDDGSRVRGATFVIGHQSGVSGEVAVDGANSTLESKGGIDIGQYGNGKLTITNHGTVLSSTDTYNAYSLYRARSRFDRRSHG